MDVPVRKCKREHHHLLGVEENRSQNGRRTELVNRSPDVRLAGTAGANRDDDTVGTLPDDIGIRALEDRRGVDDDVVVHVSQLGERDR
jgi:hypothetical protein